MKNLTEAKIKHIMEPLKAAEFEARFRVCDTCGGCGAFMITRDESDACPDCEGTGYVSQYEPDDGSEVGL